MAYGGLHITFMLTMPYLFYLSLHGFIVRSGRDPQGYILSSLSRLSVGLVVCVSSLSRLSVVLVVFVSSLSRLCAELVVSNASSGGCMLDLWWLSNMLRFFYASLVSARET